MALVIIVILASLAYPSYHKQVIRMRRLEAQGVLLQLMQQQERARTRSNTYVAFSAGAAEPEARQFKWWSGNSPESSSYELEGKACDGELLSQCIQILAKPGTARVVSTFRDDDCQQLTLTSSGQRLASGPKEHCWP